MICTPEDALTKACCIDLSRKCGGKSCMAWKEETKRVPVPGTENEIHSFESTGKGYCGHIKHNIENRGWR